MRLYTTITRTAAAMFLGALVATTAAVYAQALNPQPAVSCEQQLDSAQRVILQLRKQAAQAEFQNVTMQEQLMEQQKKHAEGDAKGKAAEKK